MTRRIIWAVASVVLLAVLGELALYAANLWAVKRAADLLNEVRGLTPGKTTQDDVLRIVTRYGGDVGDQVSVHCEEFAPDNKFYAVEVQSKLGNWIGTKDMMHGTSLRLSGSAVWKIDVSFGLIRGYLSCVRFQVVSTPAHSDSVAVATEYHLPFSESDTTPYFVGFRDVHSVESLDIVTTVRATAEQHRRAFDFHLQCLTSINGCRSVDGMMPSAWLDYQNERRTLSGSRATRALPALALGLAILLSGR